MKVKKLFVGLLVGGFCNYSLMAMENTNMSSYEKAPSDIHTRLFEDLDVKSVVQLRCVSTTMLGHVTQCFLSLNRHQLVVSEITDNMLGHVNIFANLTELNLGQWGLCLDLTDTGLQTLQLTNLKQLDLGGSYQITPTGLSHINLTNLNQLNISNCGGLMNGTLDYGNLTNLTSLNMCGLEVNTDDELSRLNICTNLTSLDLGGWVQITDPSLLMSLTNLKQLSLEGCSGIMDAGLSNLNLPSLIWLKVTDCWQITDGKIQELKDKNPNLEIINK